MRVNFVDLNYRAIEYVEKMRLGEDVNDNFDKLSELFEPIIRCLIKKIAHTHYIDEEDLKQEAYTCLWNCCNSYDLDRKTSFYTYFYGIAFKKMTDYVFVNQNQVIINKNEKQRIKPLKEFANEYYKIYNSYPSLDDYVKAGFGKKISKRFCDYLLNYKSADFDIEEISEQEDDEMLIEDFCIKKEQYEKLHEAIQMLDEKYRKVVECRFIKNLKYASISDELNISITEIRRREAKAMELLKEYLQDY